jgi:2-keto-4-pentenoate hydratase/2-oxohepta-3-ene-1,7-dioic acid hydratase in catechol pathway
MRLVTYEVQTVIGPFRRVGLWQDDDTVVDVNFLAAEYFRHSGNYEDAYREADYLTPSEMISFIAGGKRTLDTVRETLSLLDSRNELRGAKGEQIIFQRDDIRLRAPLPRPRRIHDFMVVEEHVRNSLNSKVPDEWYNMPVCYKGNPDSIIGPDDTVRWPSYTEKLDYELELCAIIGRSGKNIPASEARPYIYGYSIFNDFSARDIQMREMSVGLGPFKGKDFATGIGPCIATADEFDALHAPMRFRVNGEEWSSGSVGQMRFSFEQIIEYLSNEEEIYPGDVLGSGTVGRGCGLELDRWIAPGDLLEADVEGIGVLSNTVGERG